jgi:large subunit ribosomal protein L5
MNKARLQEEYSSNIRFTLQEELGLKNIMEVPKIRKIVVNVGAGRELLADSKIGKTIAHVLSLITGQKAVQTKARKSIAAFKIREGMPLGYMVTLRGKRMYEFLDRLINIALPTVRDFQGVTPRFDARGNYNVGIKEWIIFPEVDYDIAEKILGLNVTITTNTNSSEHAYALLKHFGMPFKKQVKVN